MSTASTTRSGPGPGASPDPKITGYTATPGPYEAIVVGYGENTRSGQLKVYIPELCGPMPTEEGIAAPYETVSYASPFFGVTSDANTGELPLDKSIFAPQSYGMWFVPPDIGNIVLVIFCNGNKDKGYWFACPMITPDHHMVPGIARHVGGNDKIVIGDSPAAKYLTNTSYIPAAESNINSPQTFAPDGLTQVHRYLHTAQAMTLAAQGLDRDPVRGAISSSSLREAPSNVYGISTPGRKLTPSDQDPTNPEIVYVRKGGHTFVMDDGDKDGNDQLIRLRTTGGHQILMNDKENVLYIASNTGNQWLEFSPNGAINIYGEAGINMRSMGPLNFHSDSVINMDAQAVNIRGSGGIKLDSLAGITVEALGLVKVSAGASLSLVGLGFVNLQAGGILKVGAIGPVAIDSEATIGLNCGAPPTPIPAIPSIPKGHPDADHDGLHWVAGAKSVQSICTVVPGHEPWVRPAPKKK